MNSLEYSSFDYLCDEPYFLDGIGKVKCPTLREIRKITYSKFNNYLQLLLVTANEFINANKITGINGECPDISIFELLIYTLQEDLTNMISFFVIDNFTFDKENMQFIFFDNEEKAIGSLNDENFDVFRFYIKKILGMEKQEEEPQKFKNEYVRKMYEKMKKHDELQRKSKKTDDDYLLDNMIRKYCTNNKVGINILNVWDMTYYQFTSMFCEYSYSRQCDNQDSIAANSFSYKNTTDYNSMNYMKRIK